MNKRFSAVLGRLGCGCACFLVPELAVDDRCEPVRGVAAHVLPDVEDGTAGRIDQCAALAIQLLEQLDGDPEGREDHDVIRRERIDRLAGVGQKSDALSAKLRVDVGVVDDFAGEHDRPLGKPHARLVGVVDGAIDPVTEAELTREMHGQATRLKLIVLLLDRRNQVAVVALGERPCDFVFEVEPFTKNKRGHPECSIVNCRF